MAQLVSYFILICFFKQLQEYPVAKHGLFALYTFSMGYLLGGVACLFDSDAVILASVLTVVILAALSAFAVQVCSSTDEAP